MDSLQRLMRNWLIFDYNSKEKEKVTGSESTSHCCLKSYQRRSSSTQDVEVWYSEWLTDSSLLLPMLFTMDYQYFNYYINYSTKLTIWNNLFSNRYTSRFSTTMQQWPTHLFAKIFLNLLKIVAKAVYWIRSSMDGKACLMYHFRATVGILQFPPSN